MQLMRIGAVGAEKPVARIDDETYVDLSDVVDDFGEDFFGGGGLAALGPVVADRSAAGQVTRFAGERIGAPIARPHQILGIGLNYSDHAAETGQPVPSEPIMFNKAPNTLVGPYDDVRIPRGSTKPDWEVELGIVIGRRTSYLDSVEEAGGSIAGFLVVNDISERAFQIERGRPVGEGEVRGDVQPGRAVAGHAGRDRRRQCLGPVAGRQRRTPADRQHRDDGLRPVLPGALRVPVPGAGAG